MSLEGKHTPAPWHIDLKSPFVSGGDYRSVKAMTPDGKMVVREIASLPFEEDEENETESGICEEDIANAHLIAAAPYMLEALKDILAHVHPGTESEAFCLAGQAVARAEGRY